jgi:hypothetical protein
MLVRRKKYVCTSICWIAISGDDATMQPLMRRIESARVSHHADEPRALREIGDGLRVRNGVGERNLDLHVLAGVQGIE